MFSAIGFVVTLVCVFGGFVLAGGKIGVVMAALPHEMLTIAGGSVGAFLVANSTRTGKSAFKGIRQVFKGPHWKASDYRDLLCLMFELIRVLKRQGSIGLEKHIEDPKASPMFSRYPRLLEDHHLTDFICDFARMMTLNSDDPHQMAEIIEGDIEKVHHEDLMPQHALQQMAEGLPAIGIVAAVLGVIKTMSSIDQPTEVLGAMIGGALVGTFLGVLLSYTVVGPLAQRLKEIVDEDHHMFKVVKEALVAYMHGLSPEVAIEAARRAVPSWNTPTFGELEKALEDLPKSLGA